MKRPYSDVQIDAPPERVWDVLTDFDSLEEWNPFLLKLDGDLEVGGKLEVTVQPVDRKPMTFHPTVVVAEPNREIRWVGRVGFKGVFDGEHSLRVEPRGDGTSRFIQEERFTGVLVPFVGSVLRHQAGVREDEPGIEGARGGLCASIARPATVEAIIVNA